MCYIHVSLCLQLKTGAHIIVIGIGGWLDPLELSQMASAPYSKNKIDVRNFDALQNIKQRIINMICDSMYIDKYT